MEKAATIREYYSDTYQFEGKAKINAIKVPDPTKPERILYLNSTVFHPQGGGQPFDEGIICNATSEFKVTAVANEGELIAHKGTLTKGELKEGDEVNLKINAENRKLYARIHSAGHLLDVAFHSLGYKNEGTKGYHFPKGAYVEYAGKADIKDIKKFIDDMDAKLHQLITVLRD